MVGGVTMPGLTKKGVSNSGLVQQHEREEKSGGYEADWKPAGVGYNSPISDPRSKSLCLS